MPLEREPIRIEDFEEDRPKPQHLWEDWRWIAAIAALFFSIAIATVGISAARTRQDVNQFKPIVDGLAQLAVANAEAIGRMDRAIGKIEGNQAGIDELVDFVRDLKAEEEARAGQPSSSQMFVNLLCSSSDPARLAACEQLRQEGTVP